MRKRAIAALVVVAGAASIWTTGAEAAPTELTVRIEGATKTLFEGPILSDGHDVQASSDSTPRRCDGTNNAAHPQPGPTPTAAAVDAMGLVGQGFDGDWHPGFDDYFVERWGPDGQEAEGYAYWGVLVNGAFTPVGGCQWADQPGDEVLWAYDAFSSRPFLWLAAASDPASTPAVPAPAQVEVGQPLALQVASYGGGEGPVLTAAAGVKVAPVETEAGTSFQTAAVGSPAAVTSGAGGAASVTFDSPGWQRLKAQEDLGYVRSNRLDVCVEPPGGGGCGPLPADSRLRVPNGYEAPPDGGGEPAPPGGGLPPARPNDEKGAPPAAPPLLPANAISLRGGSLDRAKGTGSLSAFVPGAGRLAVSGAGIVSQTVAATGAGRLTLKIKPTAKARRTLRSQGELRTRLTIEFTPSGGEPSSQQRAWTLKLLRPRR